MKNFIYIIIAISIFVFAFCVCFKMWAEKEVFVHRACFHRYKGAAVLVDKMYYEKVDGYSCHWKPSDRPKIDERWDTCRDFNIGDTNYNYPEASYTCD